MELDVIDRKGLIREAYRIDGITAGECRSIFLDWALSVPHTVAPKEAIAALLDAYADTPADHPMTAVLREGLSADATAKRRGGRRGRMSSQG